ncbi:hypothetical protein D3C71_1280400 [compost metagenome]
MNLLRCFALTLCLAPLCISSAIAQAAQPASHAQAAQGKPAQKAAAKPAASHKKAKPARKPVAKPLPQPKLDLSLPVEMVNELEPNVGNSTTRRKPLLPSMFTEKPASDESPFQLRLINNEMQLQLRNDSRREVDGAAIEFEYRQ